MKSRHASTSQSCFSKLQMAKVVNDLYESVPVTRYIAGACTGEVHRLVVDARRGRSLAARLYVRKSVDEPLQVVEVVQVG